MYLSILQSSNMIDLPTIQSFRPITKAQGRGLPYEASPFLSPFFESGGDLLSRAVSSQVPSALKVLTSVFGMGTGGTPSPLPPEISFQGPRFRATLTTAQLLKDFCQLLDLVSVS